MSSHNFSRDFNYPESVMKYSHDVLNTLGEDNFFDEEEIDPRIFFENLCESCMSKFIQGESLILEEKEMLEVITLSAAQSVLESLKSRGMLDSIPDESGEERYFLTEEGKQVADMIIEEDKKKDKGNN